MHPLLEKNRENIAELCRAHHVHRLSVFGSAARDDFDPEHSDLDFLVEFTEDGRRRLRNYFSFSDALQHLLCRRIDLVSERAVRNEYFLRAVSADKQLIYAA
jgi:predicted nucleotidyltransferase